MLSRKTVILVSRIITTYLKAFQHLRSVVVHHIPHQHSEAMAQKSQIVSTCTALLISHNFAWCCCELFLEKLGRIRLIIGKGNRKWLMGFLKKSWEISIKKTMYY